MGVLLGKFRAKSFVEFFNRLWGTGVLLFIIGLLAAGIGIYWQDSSLSIFDLGNTVIWVAIALLIWIGLELVGIVNEGDTPLYAAEMPNREVEFLKLAGGSVIFVAFGFQIYLDKTNVVDLLTVSIISAVITGMWLIGLSWFFGGLSGLLKLRKESDSKQS